jgi:hypothetical protein
MVCSFYSTYQLIFNRGVDSQAEDQGASGEKEARMLCCLLSALLAGNAAIAGRAGVSLLRQPGAAAVIVLLLAVAGGIAVAPAVAEHTGHYAARAEVNHRSVLEEILAQPLCSGEARR